MTLAGGDPRNLTLRSFLDAAYALLIEEYVRIGKPLLIAIEENARYAAGEALPSQDGGQAVNPDAQVAANDRSLAELQKMMGGVR